MALEQVTLVVEIFPAIHKVERTKYHFMKTFDGAHLILYTCINSQAFGVKI